uniref:Uncharacterized protein n=1 Tax=Tetranychus urticae TaxID=32264 RepID=T1L080_TETUR
MDQNERLIFHLKLCLIINIHGIKRKEQHFDKLFFSRGNLNNANNNYQLKVANKMIL